MIDWIKKNICPPGIEKPNRLAIFTAIGEVMSCVRKDADKAFYAHFPYLSDDKKLEEHGRALLVPRLLHDTPEEYRNRVATASFFLAKAGERAYIMGQLEERFGERFIVLEDFLSIHTKVAGLTDDERTWALCLLDSLADPNVYLELSEWFHYFDALPAIDAAEYYAHRRDFDLFDDQIYRNARILRNGETVLNAKIAARRRGWFCRDGLIQHSAYAIPDSTEQRKPLCRRSGIREIAHMWFSAVQPDAQTAALPRSGLLRRNGEAVHNCIAAAFDAIPPLGLQTSCAEQAAATETFSATSIGHNAADAFRDHKHDGSIIRNGAVRRSNYALEVLQLRAVCTASWQESVSMSDAAAFGIRKHHFHDGLYQRTAHILHSGMVLIPEAQIA